MNKKICFLILFIAVIFLLAGCGCSVSSKTETIKLDANIGFSETQVRIINNNNFDWTNVKFSMNYNWDLKTPIIKAERTYIVGLGQFTKSDEEKFNIWTHKPEHLNIYCDIPGGNKGKYHCEPAK